MQDVSTIIRFLNLEGPVSGSELGEALGISRMAVQKRMQALADLGLPVTAVRGVGYVLEDDVALLDASRMQYLFIPSVSELVNSVEVFQAIESTNTSSPFSSGNLGWENSDIGQFLESAAACGLDHLPNGGLEPQANPWKRAASIIYAGKIYE